MTFGHPMVLGHGQRTIRATNGSLWADKGRIEWSNLFRVCASNHSSRQIREVWTARCSDSMVREVEVHRKMHFTDPSAKHAGRAECGAINPARRFC